MSQTVRAEVSPKSHEWGYKLGSVYIRKVHFRDAGMIRQIEEKVVNRLRQVTSAIKQDGANQVSIITSTAERQAAVEFAKAAAMRPQIVGEALQQIASDPEVAAAMFEILETAADDGGQEPPHAPPGGAGALGALLAATPRPSSASPDGRPMMVPGSRSGGPEVAMRRAGRVSIVLLLAVAPAPAAERRASAPPSFAAGTERVIVDFVVRDKQDAILRGLTAADVEVYEAGVRHEVESLEFVERTGPGDGAGSRRDPAGLPGRRVRPAGPGRPALRAGDDARLPRASAASAVLDGRLLDRPRTQHVQPFTADRDALREALDRSLAPASYAGARDRDKVRKAWGGLASGPASRTWPPPNSRPSPSAGPPRTTSRAG